MAEVDGVREYQRIRRFLGHIYLYGFFSRDDFARAGIGSVKDYDYGVKLIRSVFPDSEESALWQAGKKYLRIQREYAHSGENRMTDSYLLHTMDEKEELPELLLILAALSKGPKTLEELCREVELHSTEGDTSKYGTVRRRALDLAQYGYVIKRKNVFSLAPDGLSRLEDMELARLYDYVRFAAGVTYPRTAGSFLRRTLERELLRRGYRPAPEVPFLLRHSVNFNVFDEELVYQLLDAIQGHSTAFLKLQGRTAAAVPVALRIDARLGRWYLLAMESGPVIYRVSDIMSVKRGGMVPAEDWKRAKAEVLRAFAHAGCSGSIPEDGPVLVEAELCFQDAPGMRAQFAREVRIGAIIAREGKEYYQAEMNDPMELMPLLRSFAPWLRVLPGRHDLDSRLLEDLRRMRATLEQGAET